ncbi:MAG: fumarate hydratase [Candidatus Bathyarchaeia archaeon]
MTKITEKLFYDVAYELLWKSYTRVRKDVVEAYKRAYEKETNPISKAQLKVLLDTIEIGVKEGRVICQDTGTPTFYVAIGSDSGIKLDVEKVLTEVTAKLSVELPFRHHIINPITGDSPETSVGDGIPVIWYSYLPGADYVEIMAAPRGGGGAHYWIAPSGCFSLPFETEKSWTHFVEKCIIKNYIEDNYTMGCGPNIVGVCIGGGNIIQTLQTAWTAVYRRPVGAPHPNPEVAQLERNLCELYNRFGKGNTRGLAPGLTNVIAVHVEVLYTRGEEAIGGPIAVTCMCSALRDERARIYSDGRVEYLEV